MVGVLLTAETARKEAAGPGSLLFTMLDELNKYAPREGSSPIKDVLLDSAERGRSLGIILIGAQQTARTENVFDKCLGGGCGLPGAPSRGGGDAPGHEADHGPFDHGFGVFG